MSRHFVADRALALVELLRPERRTRVVEVGANPINENPYRNLLSLGHSEVWGFEGSVAQIG